MSIKKGSGKAIRAWMIVAFKTVGMTVRAHTVPVLQGLPPVQPVLGQDVFVGVLGKPALSSLTLGAVIPGEGKYLLLATLRGDQVLL